MDILSILVIILTLSLMGSLGAYLTLLAKYNKLYRRREHETRRARQRAQKIIERAYSLSDDIKSDVQTSVKEAIGEVSDQVRVEVEGEVEDFKATLDREAAVSKESLKSAAAASYDQVRGELEEYKKAKMAEIDTRAQKAVEDFAKSVIGEAIDLKSHQKLVVKALEDAKRQNLL